MLAARTATSKLATPSAGTGEVEGVVPTIGACVVLQAQGESSVLRVESAEGCRERAELALGVVAPSAVEH